MADNILMMKGIVKEFSGVRALDNVNLSIERGEIHALCGENGAGKSTLMNVLSGLYPYGSYDGEIYYEGELCKFKDLRDSEDKGIVIIHQELALSPYLSIKENIFLGNEQAKHGIIDWDLTEKKTDNLLKIVGLKLDPNTLVSQIGVGHQQLVEIAKAFSKSVRLLILDEPTAALNEEESANLLELIKEFRNQGITSIIISHKLNEIVNVADRITILREVKNWTVHHPIDHTRVVNENLNLMIRKGEIIGIAGLMGAGRTEFAMSVFGHSYGSSISGEVYKDGQPISVKDVPTAIKNGLAYVSEDRKALGLNLLMDIRENTTIASLAKISRQGVIDKEKEVTMAEEFRKKMRTKTNSKVVLAKWLMTTPDILFLDEPTRGIDVGAKYEIYTIIEEMAAAGKAICIISSELPELLGMCDRIYTMNEGRFTGEVLREEADQERLMNLMTLEESGV